MPPRLHASRHSHLQWRAGYLRGVLEIHRQTPQADEPGWKATEADLLARIDLVEAEMALFSPEPSIPPRSGPDSK